MLGAGVSPPAGLPPVVAPPPLLLGGRASAGRGGAGRGRAGTGRGRAGGRYSDSTWLLSRGSQCRASSISVNNSPKFGTLTGMSMTA